LKIKPIEIKSVTSSTKLAGVTRTSKVTFKCADVFAWDRRIITIEVDGIPTPALTAVFHTRILILRADRETAVNGHGHIVLDLM
jgi:hypothetical protein